MESNPEMKKPSEIELPAPDNNSCHSNKLPVLTHAPNETT